MENIELAKKIVKILSDKKGDNIKLVNVADVTEMTDFLVICTGNASTHVKALADEVEYQLKKLENPIQPDHIEGHGSNSWVLIDYIDIVVHVFSNEARDFYNLDRLWEDGEFVDISDIVD